MRTVAPWCLLLAGCSIVDETGYLCGDGTRVPTAEDCAGFAEDVASDTDAPPDAADSDDSDEAAGGGGGAEGRIAWTAEAVPGVDPVYVYLVGYPGSNPGGGAVTATVGGATYDAAETGSGFVVAVMAAADDEIVLTSDGVPLGAVVVGALSAPLSNVDLAAEAGFGDGVDAPAQPGEPVEVAVPVAQAGFTTDTVVFNLGDGLVVAVGEGTPSLTVSARAGDRVCIAEDDGEGLSTALCRDVAFE